MIVRDGVVEAGWRVSRKRGGLEISFNDPDSIPREIRAPVDAEIADIARFEGAPVTLAADRMPRR